MKPVQPVGFPERWPSAPLWTLFRRSSRRGHEEADLLSVYRDFGVVPRGFTEDNWNRIPEDLSNYLLVEPGDLVLNKMKAWQGSLGVSEHRGIVSPAYFVYTPVRGSYEPRFLHALLRSRPFIESYGRMSGGVRVDQWDLDPWAFSRLQIPLPPLPEQRGIADFLDRETAKIDALIEKQNAMIDLLVERRATTVQASTERWKGEVFHSVRARFLCDISTGSGDTQDATASGEYPFYVRSDVPLLADKFEFDGPAVLTAGDGAGVGKVFHLVDGKFMAHQRVYVLQRFRRVSANYFYYAFSARFARRARDGSAKSTVDSVRRNMIADLSIPVPATRVQEAIVAHLDRETAKIDALITKAQQFVELARERRAAIITAAVTGQIDVTRKAA